MRLPVARGDDDERAAGDVPGAGGFELAPDMRRNAHDVLHHGDRILENPLVDFLVDVADAHPALIVGGGVGFVDVADLERLGVQNLAVNLELPRNLLKLFFLISHKSVLLCAPDCAAAFALKQRETATLRPRVKGYDAGDPIKRHAQMQQFLTRGFKVERNKMLLRHCPIEPNRLV